ncbi:MAG: hypothetical protein WDN45_10065 [Caulobacteraceae bacterium]
MLGRDDKTRVWTAPPGASGLVNGAIPADLALSIDAAMSAGSPSRRTSGAPRATP